MLSPHNSISKSFYYIFDYVYSISLVRGEDAILFPVCPAWAVHRASNGPVCLVSAEEPLLCWATERTSVASQDQVGGSQWPLTWGPKSAGMAALLPRANLKGVLRPQPEGKERKPESRVFPETGRVLRKERAAPFVSRSCVQYKACVQVSGKLLI